MSRKKKDDKWLQIDNFLIGVEKNSNGTRVCVRSVGGEWRVCYGEASLMYAQILHLAGDAACHTYLKALLTLMYVATSYPHDMVSIVERQTLPVINGFCKLIDEQTQFEVSVAEKHTEKEDEAALKEVVEMQDIMDELEKLDAENDKMTESTDDGN